MRKIKIAIAPALAVGLLAAGAATAHAAATGHADSGDTYYVSPWGQSGDSDYSCDTAAHSSINAAIAAASAGDTVVVCDGIYHEQVVVRKPLTLIGRDGAVIDAAGQSRLNVGGELPGSIGIGVVGTHDVRVAGFKVEDAGFDGILVARSSYVTVTDNVLVHNGYVGVDLNGSSLSHVTGNLSEYNAGGGFLVADDLGRTSHNDISYNVASHNPGGGGVILAGHCTAGITDNLIAHNLLTDNGTARNNSGGGVVITTDVPKETVTDNLVTDNTIHGNGLAGVTIHAHLPGQNLNGNWITGNDIGLNGILADPIGLSASPWSKNIAVPDDRTTGILVGTASPIRVRISGNNIHDDHYGVFLEGEGAVVYASLHGNDYNYVDVLVEQIGG
jgi:parallel beta-helix repeat protein